MCVNSEIANSFYKSGVLHMYDGHTRYSKKFLVVIRFFCTQGVIKFTLGVNSCHYFIYLFFDQVSITLHWEFLND